MRNTLLAALGASTLLLCLTGGVRAQDFTVRILDCPGSAKAGQDLAGTFSIQVRNDGKAAVQNTRIDIVLKKQETCPPAGRPAVYSPDFFDGVLLREGRHYVSLEPGETSTFRPYGATTIPPDTPVGRDYFLCAAVTSGEAGTEKSGACACCPMKISGSEARPVISGFSEPCGNRGGTVTIQGRDFGSQAGRSVVLAADGMNIELGVVSWGDGAITVRLPADARIQEGRPYQIGIRRSDQSEQLSNWKAVSVCASRKPPEAPVTVPPPVPPFLVQ